MMTVQRALGDDKLRRRIRTAGGLDCIPLSNRSRSHVRTFARSHANGPNRGCGVRTHLAPTPGCNGRSARQSGQPPNRRSGSPGSEAAAPRAALRDVGSKSLVPARAAAARATQSSVSLSRRPAEAKAHRADP